MKAAITVKTKGGYLTFPYQGIVTVDDLENSSVVSTEDYNHKEKVGRGVVDTLAGEIKTDE